MDDEQHGEDEGEKRSLGPMGKEAAQTEGENRGPEKAMPPDNPRVTIEVEGVIYPYREMCEWSITLVASAPNLPSASQIPIRHQWVRGPEHASVIEKEKIGIDRPSVKDPWQCGKGQQ
jgi:hypothetical protein